MRHYSTKVMFLNINVQSPVTTKIKFEIKFFMVVCVLFGTTKRKKIMKKCGSSTLKLK